MKKIILKGWIVLLLIGCNPLTPGESSISKTEIVENKQTLNSPTEVITMEQVTSTPPDPGLEPLIEKAKKDLAQRLSISLSEVKVLEASSVVWPDSSFGCPQSGMAYLQIPEDGALIVLEVAGLRYEYHHGGSRGLFLCERTLNDVPTPSKLDFFNLTPSKSDPPPTTPDNSIPPGEDT